MDLLCATGLALSFLCVICKAMRDTVSFILLWMLYFSLYQVGQTFLWFQDILLLEAGFLTILVAPFNVQMPIRRFRVAQYHQHDTITLWLVRWLLFRLMFSSGIVKLTSRCPTWWKLTVYPDTTGMVLPPLARLVSSAVRCGDLCYRDCCSVLVLHSRQVLTPLLILGA
ncbi:LMF2-like protein, partial [Mya arenaria]